jgi:putative CocE/NonD family hydrolase
VQLLAAAEAPPHLKAIAPAVTSPDFHSHWTYEGGALHLAFVATWAVLLAENVALRAGDRETLSLLRQTKTAPHSWLASAAPIDLPPLAQVAPFYRDWLAHPQNDKFWQTLSVPPALRDLQIPALHIAGWYDIFLEGNLAAWGPLQRPAGSAEQMLVIGPWYHYPWGGLVGEARFDGQSEGTALVARMQLAFFHRHLDANGSSTGSEASVRYYVLFDGSWKESSAWPPPGSLESTFYLHSEGTANTSGGDGRLETDPPRTAEPCDLYQYYPMFPVPAVGGHSCCDATVAPMGCFDQAAVESMPEVLVYTGPVNDLDQTFAGPVEAELYVATDAVSADYTAKLCLVDEGRSWNVAEGIRRLGADELEALKDEDGTARVSVSLRSTAFRLRPGQRLRLEISSGAFPTYDLNPQTGAPPETTRAEEARSAMHAVLHQPGSASRLRLTVLTLGEARKAER